MLWFLFCVWLCRVLCCAEASEVLRSTLEVQQALIKELREQTQILAQEKETLEKRCLQQSQHIERLRQELCQPHTERGSSTGASSLAAIHPTVLTEPNIKVIALKKWRFCHDVVIYSLILLHIHMTFSLLREVSFWIIFWPLFHYNVIKWKKTWALKSQSFCMTSEDFGL